MDGDFGGKGLGCVLGEVQNRATKNVDDLFPGEISQKFSTYIIFLDFPPFHDLLHSNFRAQKSRGKTDTKNH